MCIYVVIGNIYSKLYMGNSNRTKNFFQCLLLQETESLVILLLFIERCTIVVCDSYFIMGEIFPAYT